MSTCCIINCKNRYTTTKNIQFHRFPKEIAVRQQWLNACQRKESDIKIDVARICSIHFEESCFPLVKKKPRLMNNKPVKERLRLKKGSIPTKFLNLEKTRKRRMSQSKEDNKKIKVPGKSFVSTELVQYAQQKQRLSQEETVTRMETDVAQNMEEAVKNMERNTLQDPNKKKVTKNIDKVATQNIKKQSKVIKQQVKQGINDNTNYVRVKTLSMQLRKRRELNRKLIVKNKNVEKRIRDLNKQVAQLQAEIKNMKDKRKEEKAIIIALRRVLRELVERLTSEDIARAVSSL